MSTPVKIDISKSNSIKIPHTETPDKSLNYITTIKSVGKIEESLRIPSIKLDCSTQSISNTHDKCWQIVEYIGDNALVVCTCENWNIVIKRLTDLHNLSMNMDRYHIVEFDE